MGVALQQTLSTPFQAKQLLHWEFHSTVQALTSWDHQFMLEKPDVLEKHVRALVFLLASEILLWKILNLDIQNQTKPAVSFTTEQW